MKANLKGLSGIKGLALRHGEKILITIVGLVAVWFMYSSLKLPSLKEEYQADNLKGKISATNTAMTSSTWPTAPDAEGSGDIRVYEEIAKNASVPVDPNQYSFGGLNPPVVAATLLRGDAPVLTAVGIKAYGQTGILGFQDRETLEETNRRRQLKEEEKQKKEQDRLAKQTAEGAKGEGGLRGPGGPEGGLDVTGYDPEHPKRRPVEGMGGTLAGIPLQGGERLERAYWATVVAKVPIREQLERFNDAFRNARGYDAARDFPQYVGFQVERCEVVGGKQTPWVKVYVYDGQRKYLAANTPAGRYVNDVTVNKLNTLAGTEWVGASLEPVDPRWTDMMLTLPLPPLVGRNFGADATHPDIPLAKDAPPPEETLVPTEAPAEQPAEGEDDGTFTAGAPGQQRPAGEFTPSVRAMTPYGGGEFPGGPGGMGMRSMGPGMGGPEGEFRGMAPGAGMMAGGGIASGQRTTLPREVDFLLLRFFDYTVQPGKEYQYRVRVFLVDPNSSFSLDSGVLDGAVVDRRIKERKEAESKKQPVPWFRAAEWSEPSSVVGIPIGGTVHVAEARLPSGKTANDEPAIKLIAETFDIEPADGSAIHVAQETELRRGAVINLKGEMQYTVENDRLIDVKEEYALNTGLTVLDVDGGKELAKKMTTPSRVLLMDGAGQLFVRDEVADKTSVKYLRFVFSDDRGRNKTNAPGQEFGGPDAMMRRGPGRGGR